MKIAKLAKLQKCLYVCLFPNTYTTVKVRFSGKILLYVKMDLGLKNNGSVQSFTKILNKSGIKEANRQTYTHTDGHTIAVED